MNKMHARWCEAAFSVAVRALITALHVTDTHTISQVKREQTNKDKEKIAKLILQSGSAWITGPWDDLAKLADGRKCESR